MKSILHKELIFVGFGVKNMKSIQLVHTLLHMLTLQGVLSYKEEKINSHA